MVFRGKASWLTAGLAVAVLAAAVVVLQLLPKKQSPVANNTNAAAVRRAEYAALYEAAWRQDQGLGSTVVTATLFTARMTADLAADAGRSDSERQLLEAVQAARGTDLPFFITIDSVASPVSDQAIQASLELTDAQKTSYQLKSWSPLIGQSNIINASAGSSQSGVAIFSAPQTVNWSQLKDLTLTVKNIGDQPTRKFIWAEPGLLSNAQ